MTHNILWTSGWDSTYRVLDLVLNKKDIIQPYYILDVDRMSTDIELETIEKIKSMIYALDIDAKTRIKDIITFNIQDITENDEISKAYWALADKAKLGGQYEWLARFAKSKGLRDLELSIHQDDKATVFLKHEVELKETSSDKTYILIDNPSIEELNLFKYFSFPLLDMTKREMEQQAKDSGFAHIMEETWFCHSPINKKPCGLCNPCKYTREEGLGRRVPNPTIKNKTIMFSRKVKKRIFK